MSNICFSNYFLLSQCYDDQLRREVLAIYMGYTRHMEIIIIL